MACADAPGPAPGYLKVQGWKWLGNQDTCGQASSTKNLNIFFPFDPCVRKPHRLHSFKDSRCHAKARHQRRDTGSIEICMKKHKKSLQHRKAATNTGQPSMKKQALRCQESRNLRDGSSGTLWVATATFRCLTDPVSGCFYQPRTTWMPNDTAIRIRTSNSTQTLTGDPGLFRSGSAG